MLARIADLTWNRPKTVLGLVAALVLIAGLFARDLEDHLKAAGFTDASSESERAAALLHDALGYDPNPGLVVVVRDPDGGRLDLRLRRRSRRDRPADARLSEARSSSGGSVNPLSDPDGRTALADRRGRPLGGDLRAPRHPGRRGRRAAWRRSRRGSGSATLQLDVAMGGFAPSFNEVNDQTREDLTKAELIAFPVLAVLLLLVFRGVVAAAIPLLIGVISIAGTFLVLRVMSELVDTSLFALNIATGLSLGLAVDYALLMVVALPGGAGARRPHARSPPADGPARPGARRCSRARPSRYR